MTHLKFTAVMARAAALMDDAASAGHPVPEVHGLVLAAYQCGRERWSKRNLRILKGGKPSKK